jgi:hypothetical protein
MANLLEPSETQRTTTSHLGSTVTYDEPKQATNAALTIAIIASVIIGMAMFIWGFIILKTIPYTDLNTHYSVPAEHINGQPVNLGINPESSTIRRSDGSNVGNQPVSSDALINTRIGDQK